VEGEEEKGQAWTLIINLTKNPQENEEKKEASKKLAFPYLGC